MMNTRFLIATVVGLVLSGKPLPATGPEPLEAMFLRHLDATDDAHTIDPGPSAPGAIPAANGTNRVPGEFEPQEALLMAPTLMARHHPDMLAAMLRALQGHVTIVGVVANESERDALQNYLSSRLLPPGCLRLTCVPHNTMWIRDYGPIFVRSRDQTRMAVDAEYPETGRADDDLLPQAMAAYFRVGVCRAPMVLEGGNLLSNGQGLCIVTTACLDRNCTAPDAEALIGRVFRECLGARQTVLLEPLAGEPTGHVDMFATFTSADTVVVGQYDAKVDAENAHRLDHNAMMLEGLPTPWGPLRVVRIPMPPNQDGVWRSYTNVVYANGVLLMPAYPNVDRRSQRLAMRTFARLLPGWKIVAIDASGVINSGGALHCVTANVPRGRPTQLVSPGIVWRQTVMESARASALLRGKPEALEVKPSRNRKGPVYDGAF